MEKNGVQRHVGGSNVDEVTGCHRAQMRNVQDRTRLRKDTDTHLTFPRPRGGLQYCDMRWWIKENVIAISIQYPCALLFKGRPTALNPGGIDTERLTANCSIDVNVRGNRRPFEMYTLASSKRVVD
jgi:hypothetical protein